jgi:DNA-binding NtrC family response regulator
MTTRIEKAAILIVEDEAKMRRLLELQLGEEGFLVHSAPDAESGLQLLVREKPDLVVTDLRLPGMSGLEFLQAVKRANAALPVVVMTAYGTVESAVEAMKVGASNYVTKPFSFDELVLVIRKELDTLRLREENRTLREALGRRYAYTNIVAQSDKMQAVLAMVERVAPTNSTVLLGGESGVGKDLIARAIHEHSHRASGPFIKINSTAIPENLLESELFGYEKGAFSGAAGSKPGKFELADKGTLFLDEIGDVPGAIQVKLLRVLQDREFERLGGTKTLKVDVRLVAATNRDLRAALEEGTFREDLYYRLNVVAIDIPPRTQGRRSRARQFFSRSLRKRSWKNHYRDYSRSDEAFDGLSLAGKRPRTAKHHRARRRAFLRRDARRRRYLSRRSRQASPRAGQFPLRSPLRRHARTMGRRSHPRSPPPRQRQQEPSRTSPRPLPQRPPLPPVEIRRPRSSGHGELSRFI